MAHEITPNSHEFDQWLETAEPEYEQLPMLPVLALRDSVMYPHMMVPLLVGRDRSIHAVEAAMASGNRLLTLAQLDEEIEVPEVSDLYRLGTEVIIGRKLLMPDGTLSIWVQGQRRVRVAQFMQTEPYIAATVEPVEETTRTDMQTEALKRAVLRSFHKRAGAKPEHPRGCLRGGGQRRNARLVGRSGGLGAGADGERAPGAAGQPGLQPTA